VGPLDMTVLNNGRMPKNRPISVVHQMRCCHLPEVRSKAVCRNVLR